MKYHEMTKNYIFREFECGISMEEAAKLCFKSVRTIKDWDRGKPIPKECKRLMRMKRRLELSDSEEWKGFLMNNDFLELPTGQLVTPQQILVGIALLDINSEVEAKISTKVLKFARAINKLR
ncbi:regulator [Vibrio europaeus]|uniref:regulator n=1 Tax=Vibrio europaeus TaxID=300876 RepID=UPI00233E6139|nr:regulator [Vibrio europaeus]MDC5804769.1 regulator [Vibrio europaeus]MDC5827156.1 regulator [Vibrio europaeus]MDC5832522.1 regulator [Vibrio europaeus]MDC5835477.1 regulator [Vibrio europaeus]